MGQLPRRIIGGRLYEATQRTFQSRYFFVPSRRLNQLVTGAFAYAVRKYDLDVCYATWLTNHYHMIFRPKSEEQVKAVFRLANRKIALEVQKLCDKHGQRWRGGVFCKQRSSIVEIVGGREIQLKRLEYLMSQGVKEGLCPHPKLWPGPQSASAWLSGSMQLKGIWIDRSQRYEVERGRSRRKKKVTRKWLLKKELQACEHEITLDLVCLPFMDEMQPKERTAIAHEVANQILIDYADIIAKVPRDWKKRLCNPKLFCFRPESSARGIVPEVHAESKELWRCWKIEWDDWLNLYERASRRLKRGIANALLGFPDGCFVPSGYYCRGAPGPITASTLN